MTKIKPDFESFARAYEAGRPQAVYARHVADLETPVSAFLKLGDGKDNAFLLESVQGGEARGRYSIIGFKPDLIWRVHGDVAEINRAALAQADKFEAQSEKPLASLRALIAETRMTLPAELPPMAVGLFGYLGYDMARQVEHLPNPPEDTLGLSDAILLRPTITAIFDTVKDEILVVTPVYPDKKLESDAAYARATARLDDVLAELDKPLPEISAPPSTQSVGDIKSNMTREEYYSMVARAKEYVAAGDVFQVVPSQRFRRAFTLPPFALYRALRRLNPSPFLYFLSMPGFAIVGSSPEILVRLRDGKVTIRPIAGTRPRGKTPAEDQKMAEELMSDPKERAEHLMLVDLGRNDVGRVARVGGVKVTASFFIERYSHVMHRVSKCRRRYPRRARCRGRAGSGSARRHAVGRRRKSAPWKSSTNLLLQKEKRGAAYAGAVGYFAADGSMDTCIVLRTALLKDGTMYVQAGGGIVADSQPEAEYQETVSKARALMAAAEEAARFASVKKGQ